MWHGCDLIIFAMLLTRTKLQAVIHLLYNSARKLGLHVQAMAHNYAYLNMNWLA